MEDKQCKQIERFSVTAERNGCFLSLDDKSKQGYKVKINDIQEYDPYQIKKDELSDDISKFLPVQLHNLLQLITFNFLRVHWL